MGIFRILLVVVFLGLCLTSCTITNQVRIIQLEVLKPGIFELPKNLRTVAIFNRDIYHTDTCIFRYKSSAEITTDTTIKVRDLANSCVDRLAKEFEKQNFFQKVINFRDSLTYPSNAVHDIHQPDEFFKKSGADACIFLNYVNLNTNLLYSSMYLIPLRANLWWSIVFRDDSTSYLYNQNETITLNEFGYLSRKVNFNPETALRNAAGELGKSMAAKLIPEWQPVERIYYRSKNLQMLAAEKFALEYHWLEAAETWNPLTKNKNQELAGKACFNMALACEMLDKHSLAIEWLSKSKMMKITSNETHVTDCDRYTKDLQERLQEIDNLKKLTGIPGKSENTEP